MIFWNYEASGYEFLIYGLIFFMLSIILCILPKYNTTWSFAPHLSLLAAFSILHGMAEFIEMQRMKDSTAWLIWLSCVLTLASYLPLLEFTRRTWNDTYSSMQLSEPWLFGTASLVLAALGACPRIPSAEHAGRFLRA